ncbi:MAG: helix-turn-helix domain-containing protein [Actinomycetota bacterium]|nr:helix-turn-helix domain-containing protein [Actinomycetota bacterium]
MTTTTAKAPDDNLLRAAPAEVDALDALLDQLQNLSREQRAAQLRAADGTSVEVPPTAIHALELLVQGLTRGQAISLVTHGSELTTQEAADLLHVSRPHLIKLLDDGTIDHYKVGTHRRVRIDDALAYRERRAGIRREKLDELTRLSEELPGGYR